MRSPRSISILLAAIGIAVAGSSPVLAQAVCATGFGSCPMVSGVAGAPCLCPTAGGPVPGVTQVFGAASMTPLPQFCCTPAGRVGPFNNTMLRAGQVCQVGQILGQACY